MQTVTIDLKKSPEIADVLADKQPGDEVCLYGTIKHIDDQTAVITVAEIEDKQEEAEEEPGGNEGSADASYDKTAAKPGSAETLRDFAGGGMASM